MPQQVVSLNRLITPILTIQWALALVVISFFACKKAAEQPAAPLDPAPLLKAAEALRVDTSNHDHVATIHAFREILPLLRANNDSLATWLIVHRRIAGIMDIKQNRKKEALMHLDTVWADLVQWRQPDKYSEYNNLCLLYMREMKTALDSGALFRLKSVLERTETLFKTHLHGKDHAVAAYFYQQMANLQVRLGDYGNALNYFQESLDYEKAFDEKNIVNYNDYGSVFLTLEDYSAALHLFNKGLQTGADYYNETLLHLNKAEALIQMDSIEAARLWNHKAMVRMTQKDEFDANQYIRCITGWLENEAMICEKKQQWVQARQFYSQIITPEYTKGLQRREIASMLAGSANTWVQQGNFEAALQQYHAAYLKMNPNAPDSLMAIPSINDLPADKVLVQVLDGKARCLAELGYHKQAAEAYAVISQFESQLRATHVFEKSMLLALQQSRRRYDDAIQHCWKAWEATGDRYFAEKAFYFTEMARGTLQSKGINANEALDLLNPEQQEKDKKWSEKIAILEKELAESDNSTRINSLMQEIRQWKAEQKKFRDEMAAIYPAYAALMNAHQIVSMKDVPALLRPQQQMMDYYLAGNSHLYVFIFDQSGNAGWNCLPWTPREQAFADSLVLYISDHQQFNDPVVFRTPAAEMGQYLLHAARSGQLKCCMGNTVPQPAQSLVVVPDMVLTALPFEVLLTSTTAEVDWSQMPFAVKNYAISYAYSASLLALQKSLTHKRKGKARNSFAGFAPRYNNPADQLDNAEADVHYGAQLFGGKAFVHPEAGEEQFRKIAGSAQILLLSMHGISDHRHPGLSRLRFGDAETNGADNTLYASELQAIPCRADLAVMSACFTGDGPVQVGEGVYSLARSFAISGVPATTMSLWKLPVKSSSDLVREFLNGIKNIQPKDIALQTAKTQWLNNYIQSRFAHPYFWAGLVTAGDSDAIQPDQKNNYWRMITIGILAGLFGFWRFRKKNILTAAIIGCCTLASWAQSPEIPLTNKMVIRQSTRIKPGEYALKGSAADIFADTSGGTKCTPVIRIEGNHIEVDFQRALLNGTANPEQPDQFYGVAIVVQGNDIVLKNIRATGYKIALLAENCTDLKLIDCDFSYNYRPRLLSGRDRENLADWLSYHHNEHGEWLRYGAGIYLKNCPSAEIKGCKIKGNQNALLMSGCNDALVWNNTFQFNSGLGIGMYRCSRNKIMHNRLDWNVRGYSHGIYQRGQDSAGILLYEQSSDNLIAYNSATHCGDGLFLWAGQTTMDTGTGGCNDNLIFGNDFSHAPTNGIEVTFSRNTIRGNMIRACTYGIWGGYSYETLVAGNLISECKTALAIEHGQNNTIRQNLILDNQNGIAFWANTQAPDDWIYPQKRDTRSRKGVIDRNVFLNNATALSISASDSIAVNGENLFFNFNQLLEVKKPNNALIFWRNDIFADSSVWPAISAQPEIAASKSLNFWHNKAPENPYSPLEISVKELNEPDSLKGGIVAALPGDFPRGRQFILMEEWGPYDFRRPIAAVDTVAGNLVYATLLGPAGDWKVSASEGIKNISASKGQVPAVLLVERDPTVPKAVVRFEYSSPETTQTVFGQKIPPGQKYPFSLILE